MAENLADPNPTEIENDKFILILSALIFNFNQNNSSIALS
jgi:hypothetical protein